MWSSETVEWIDVELTSFCNIDCPGCFRQVKKNKVHNVLNKDMISFEQLKKWIDKKEFPNLTLINFCGSIDEPTLHPEILKIVDYFSKICNINISTNGSTKTKKFWKTLGQYGVSVFFGIDGIDQKSLERYRIGSNFKKVQENYREFIKSGGHATWQFIVFEHNQHLLEKAKQISKIEGFKHFRTIYSHREGNDEKKVNRKEEHEIICKYANQKRIFISHTGALLPCCFFNSEFLQIHAGNEPKTMFDHAYEKNGGVLSNNLKYISPSEVIDGELFGEIVDSWKTKPMERCWNTCKQAKQDIFIHEELK